MSGIENNNYVQTNESADFGKDNQEVLSVNTDLIDPTSFELKNYLEGVTQKLNREIADKYDVSLMDSGDISLDENDIAKIKGEIKNRVSEFNSKIGELVSKHTKYTVLQDDKLLLELQETGINLQIADLNNEKIHAITAYSNGLGLQNRMKKADPDN